MTPIAVSPLELLVGAVGLVLIGRRWDHMVAWLSSRFEDPPDYHHALDDLGRVCERKR